MFGSLAVRRLDLLTGEVDGYAGADHSRYTNQGEAGEGDNSGANRKNSSFCGELDEYAVLGCEGQRKDGFVTEVHYPYLYCFHPHLFLLTYSRMNSLFDLYNSQLATYTLSFSLFLTYYHFFTLFSLSL